MREHLEPDCVVPEHRTCRILLAFDGDDRRDRGSEAGEENGGGESDGFGGLGRVGKGEETDRGWGFRGSFAAEEEGGDVPFCGRRPKRVAGDGRSSSSS